jgi:hypothetical protein
MGPNAKQGKNIWLSFGLGDQIFEKKYDMQKV